MKTDTATNSASSQAGVKKKTTPVAKSKIAANKSAAGSTSKDAIALLKKDHREVEKAFAKFEKLGENDHASKKELADHICKELLMHMAIEEDIFYPALKDVKGAEDIVNEGVVEHASAKNLMKQIKGMKGDEELFDTKVMVLKELIDHHVKEEEKDMFPKAEKSKLDLVALGTEMEQRRGH